MEVHNKGTKEISLEPITPPPSPAEAAGLMRHETPQAQPNKAWSVTNQTSGGKTLITPEQLSQLHNVHAHSQNISLKKFTDPEDDFDDFDDFVSDPNLKLRASQNIPTTERPDELNIDDL
jgi:hypothetical protein